jgi:signal transduction histidine kinase
LATELIEARIVSQDEYIMVVDDTPQNIQLLGQILSEQGYRILVATSGKQALFSLQKKRPDLILMDIMMPEMDGFEVCQRIKANADWADIPVIFISAKVEVEDKVKGFDIGAADYITKPFESVEVLARAQTHLKLKTTLAELQKRNQQLEAEIAQRQLAERQLVQAQKMEAIGKLAAGVAHEINTPMQFIGDCTHFMSDAFSGIEQVLEKYHLLLEAAENQTVSPQLIVDLKEVLEEADLDYLRKYLPEAFNDTAEGIKRVREIVTAMRDFAHPGTGQKERTDLNQIIEKAAALSRNEWKYVADIDLKLDPALPVVYCLPGELSRVIVNLVVNAAHAIAAANGDDLQAKGQITISTGQDGEWIEVRVQDTGTGIPEAVQPNVFVPFFTTKEVDKGTGQGLAMAQHTVVVQHAGDLSFETEPDQGTTFIIRLPLNLEAASE